MSFLNTCGRRKISSRSGLWLLYNHICFSWVITEQQRVGGPSPSTLSLLLYVACTYLLHFILYTEKQKESLWRAQTWATKVFYFIFLTPCRQLASGLQASPSARRASLCNQQGTRAAGLSPATGWTMLSVYCCFSASFDNFIWQITGKFSYSCISFWQLQQLPALRCTGQMNFSASYLSSIDKIVLLHELS